MKWLDEVFEKQIDLQKKYRQIENSELLPDIGLMYASATGMMVEIGEMLQTDTRWKAITTGSKKQPVCNNIKFIEELSDVFIYLMNVLIYKGVDIDTFKMAVKAKQNVVERRFNNDNENCDRRAE